MIRSFYIDNFKSLVDFRLPMTPHALGRFVCLVGLNGAGKSTVLQALDFVGHLAKGQVQAWLDQREWKKADLTSRFLKRHLISFKVEFEFSPVGLVIWEGVFNTTLLRCTSESISVGNDTPLRIFDHKLLARMAPGRQGMIPVTRTYDLQGLQFEGSTLSILKAGQWDLVIEAVLDSVDSLRSLDMLSPQLMRRRAKEGRDIGYGGERLSAYVHGLSKDAKEDLLSALQEFYPQVQALTTKALQAGFKDLSIGERYLDANQKPIETKARHVNDGLLRTMAVLSQAEAGSEHTLVQTAEKLLKDLPVRCVLFDEIENGINPELMEKLVARLLKASAQIVVTTHSPLILNYLPDAVAREAVILLYRNEAGHTHAVRLFDLPSMREKLDLLGPGEVYVDTDLTRLPAEAESFALAHAEDTQ